MGLGGRREKQIIAADPRNTRWLNDTSSPGHRLLTGMGYDPANANSSQNKIGLYGHESSKRLKQIPMAKAGMEGIGFKPNGPGANVALGALPTRMTGGPGSLASTASTIFSKLGSRAALQFVTAGASKEVINKSKTEGGEFGGLLARLNAAASASATPEPPEPEVVEVVVQESVGGEVQDEESDDEEAKRQRKKQRKLDKAAEKAQKKEAKQAKKLAKLSKEQSADSGTETASPAPVVASATASPAPSDAAARMQHWNASRSRNLRAKRMLHASADAMAEILGIAPTPSPSVSGYSTPTSLPATIAPSNLPSTKASPAAQSIHPIEFAAETPEGTDKLDKDAEKARRKAEKKAAKALSASESAVEATRSEVDTVKDSKKKKRKRDA